MFGAVSSELEHPTTKSLEQLRICVLVTTCVGCPIDLLNVPDRLLGRDVWAHSAEIIVLRMSMHCFLQRISKECFGDVASSISPQAHPDTMPSAQRQRRDHPC